MNAAATADAELWAAVGAVPAVDVVAGAGYGPAGTTAVGLAR